MGERKFTADLETLSRDSERLKEVNDFIDLVVEDLRKGFTEQKIRKSHKEWPIAPAGAVEVARARLSVASKFTRWNRLWLDTYSASYSTPETIARYRASRVASSELIDIGSGAGMQSLFFAETCSVISVEISRLRAIMARLNAAEYGFMPSRIINADYVSVIDRIPVGKETIIFSDPLRPRTEDERTLTTLVPSPLVVRDLLVGKTERFMFDLPPQMNWENLPLKGEKEYISVNCSLNRLTLYQGDLAKSDSSAVMLPDRMRMHGKPSTHDFVRANRIERYLFIPDISVVYARLTGLISELGEFKRLSGDKRRMVLTSDSVPEDYFPGEVFSVVGKAGIEALPGKFRDLGYGKAILRFHVDPKEYYSLKERIETESRGEKMAYIFRDGDQFVLAEKDESNSEKTPHPGVTEKINY